MRPFLRWAGSKRQLLDVLSEYWHTTRFNRYVEPFVGSACLFFRANPPKAILSDNNLELIQTFQQIRNNLDEVFDILSQHQNGPEYYYGIRALQPNYLTPSERAARFIYLNRFCFNGIYRTNMNGEFNVPYGGEKSGSLPAYEDFANCRNALKKAKVVCCDFEEAVRLCRKGDFVYLDPPYTVKSRRVFKEYGPNVFNENDIKRLRRSIETLDKKRIIFLLSYGKCQEAMFLSKGFCSTAVSVRRNVAGFAGNRRVDQEIIISNIRIK